jgi:hypothetical protein
MASVARGQRGQAAIQSIVTRFERPANPGREIAGAIGAYGSVRGGGLPLASLGPSPGRGRAPISAAIGAPTQRSLDLTGVINMTNQIVGLPPVTFPITIPGPSPARPRARGLLPGSRVPSPAAAAPRRGGKSIAYLEHFAAPYGLTITSTTGGKHVKNSYHYRGRAIDVAGNPRSMMALARQALQHPEQFTEVFFDPLGVYVKNGKIYKGSIGGHSDHVHLAR